MSGKTFTEQEIRAAINKVKPQPWQTSEMAHGEARSLSFLLEQLGLDPELYEETPHA